MLNRSFIVGLATFARWHRVGIVCSAIVFAACPAVAQTQQQIDQCQNKDRAFSPDSRIDGCTAAIQSGALTPERRSIFVYVRGAAYRDRGDYDHAIADYSEAIRLEPTFVNAFNARATAYYSKKDYDRAIADYDEAIRLDPKFSPAFYGRGVARSAAGDYDRAIADFGQAIQLNPKLPPTFYNRGIAYYRKKDYDRAIADYDEAIRLDPKYANAFYNRGIAKRARGDGTGGEADMARAREFEAGIGR